MKRTTITFECDLDEKREFNKIPKKQGNLRLEVALRSIISNYKDETI
jgi:hypothetical protein